MSILEAAKADAKNIISGGFSVPIVLETPSGDKEKETRGLNTNHHLGFNSDGLPVSAQNVHICVDEADLDGYPVRNAENKVDLYRHKVTVKEQVFVVSDQYPNNTLGLIVLILSDWQD